MENETEIRGDTSILKDGKENSTFVSACPDTKLSNTVQSCDRCKNFKVWRMMGKVLILTCLP